MNWKGKELVTIGDLMDHGINKCETIAEAREFMRQYRANNEHANENIGYLSGYYSQDEADRIKEWFDVAHPIFGRSTPTAEEAFAAGVKMAGN